MSTRNAASGSGRRAAVAKYTSLKRGRRENRTQRMQAALAMRRSRGVVRTTRPQRPERRGKI